MLFGTESIIRPNGVTRRIKMLFGTESIIRPNGVTRRIKMLFGTESIIRPNGVTRRIKMLFGTESIIRPNGVTRRIKMLFGTESIIRPNGVTRRCHCGHTPYVVILAAAREATVLAPALISRVRDALPGIHTPIGLSPGGAVNIPVAERFDLEHPRAALDGAPVNVLATRATGRKRALPVADG